MKPYIIVWIYVKRSTIQNESTNPADVSSGLILSYSGSDEK
jgi:hypothetical protein